jgi:hypothetical protein
MKFYLKFLNALLFPMKECCSTFLIIDWMILFWQLFSEDLGPCAPNGITQAEHVDEVW